MIRVTHSEGDKGRFTKLVGLEENESQWQVERGNNFQTLLLLGKDTSKKDKII